MIDIILASFNGDKFLKGQIKSIQSNIGYQGLIRHIIVSDDGSTDDTEAIVKRLKEKDSKIVWIKNTNKIKGPLSNFSFGIEQSNAEYIMLCDQDDVWFEYKIEQSIQTMQRIELEHPANTPVLVFGDLQVVDEKLEEISPSYFALKKITKQWHNDFAQLAQQNVVSGCTTLLNRALIDKAMPIPEKAYMHDWWLALVASRCGEIGFIDKPLIQYRQHNNNSIGANKRSKFDLISRFGYHLVEFEKSLKSIIEQAQAFQKFECKNNLSGNKTIATLATLEQKSRYQRIKLYVNKSITRSHFAGRLALLIVLLKMEVKHTKISD